MKTNNTFLRHRFFIVLVSIFTAAAALPLQSAVPLLERTVTLTLEQERIDVALKKISQQGNFTFSYNPSILDASKIVSITSGGMTVREVLNQIFQGTVQYKARGNYIILTKAQVTETNVYSGYVVDEATGERLKNVSVYDPISLSSAVTDAYGYFQIKIDKPSPDLILAVKKQNYTDTIIAVPSGRNGLLKIPINFDKEKIATLADSVGHKFRRFWKKAVLYTQSINVDNIKDTLNRKTQVSVFPFVGTNHRLSGNVINDYSFNILGGYSRGVRKLEIGGLFNIVNGDVQGHQFAGLLNAVGGKVTGSQFAGLINMNVDTMSGAQFAGLLNVNFNSAHKFSAAGLINFTHRDANGFHMAGLSNVTIGKQDGSNLAGLFNFSTKDSGPVQLAGLYNFTGGNMRGLQGAGLFNFAGKRVRGLQLAGLMNVAPGRIKGAQVSGLLNYATKVNGLQLGLVNISDSVKGVPIGLFSFVMKGYHQIEISADEIFYTNVAFRTGVRQFYNIFTAGAKPGTFDDEDVVWSFGYGVGTAPRLTKRMNLNVDLTSSQIVKGHTLEGTNMLNKAYLGLELKPAKKIGFTFGVTLNAYITDTTYTYPEIFTDYKPHIISERNYNDNLNFKMWLGGKVGVRFL